MNTPFIRPYFYSILLFFASSEIYAQTFQLKSNHVKITYDSNFNRDVQWLGAKEHSLTYFEPQVQEGIVANGIFCNSFKIDGAKTIRKVIDHPEFGECAQMMISGIFKDQNLIIKKSTSILLPKNFENTIIFENSYQNLGSQKIRIDSVFSQRLALKLKKKTNDVPSTNYDLVSFQGGVNEWGRDYTVIGLEPGFEQTNFQGMHPTENEEVIGGGMPFIDIWSKEMGVAVAHLEKKPAWVSLPVKMNIDHSIEMGITEIPDESLGLNKWLAPNEYYNTVMSTIIFHNLDYYNALQTYGNLLRQRGVKIPTSSPEAAYKPYWKSWGFELDFTLDEIYEVLPELNGMGINIANLDDGWFDHYGDWEVNRAPGKFPGGDEDMVEFVNNIHQKGFKTNLWWYPLGVSKDSWLTKKHSDFLVMDEKGMHPVDGRGLYQLCPAYKPAMNYIETLVKRFIVDWNYDGLYSDTRGLSAVPPCFNKKHKHLTPLESFEEVPKVFEVIRYALNKYKKQAIHEVCICAVPHSPYNMPYYEIANASDPINSMQTRRRIKAEKAVHGPTYAVGDCYQVPDDEWSGFSVPQDFESAIGTGGQVTTFYTDLDVNQHKEWKRWVKEYTKKKLSSATYTNLYDIAFDKPETHVVKKDGQIYYGLYADLWSKSDTIVLRGLKEGVNYRVYDYSNNRRLENVNGDAPYINIGFRNNLLLEVVAENQ
tara:strand:- start:25815 stop:27935 length:2121 start_codon:yes stop_codon:yes gene_type:complete